MKRDLHNKRSSYCDELESAYCLICFSLMHQDDELRRVAKRQEYFLSLAVRPLWFEFSIRWVVEWIEFLVKFPFGRTCSLEYKRRNLDVLEEMSFKINLGYRNSINQLIDNYYDIRNAAIANRETGRARRLYSNVPRFFSRGDLN